MSNPALSNKSSATAQGMNQTLSVSVESMTYAGIQQVLLKRFNLPSAWMVSDSERAQVIQRLFGGAHVASETQPQSVKYPYCLLKTDGGIEVDPERGNLRAMTKYGTPVKVNDTSNKVMMLKYIPVTMRVSAEYITNDLKDLTRFAHQLLHARVQGWLHFSVQIGQTSFGVTVRPDAAVTIPQRPADEATIKEYQFQLNLEVKTWSTLETMLEQQVVTKVALDASVEDVNSTSSTSFWKFETPEDDPTVPVAVSKSTMN